MKFTFENIPEECGFSVFDYDNKEGTGESWNIPVGSTEFDFEIPEEWTSPHYSLAALKYYVPRQYEALSGSNILFSGDDYYLDVTRDRLDEELNQDSIERLIYGIQQNRDLDFRQKFYIALVSLQSYFEYLSFGMLVLSGYKSNTEFESLSNSNNRINSGFSRRNTNFFNDQIIICPGKENLGQLIDDENREKLKDIFHTIRDMRNAVVHSWSYNNLTKQELKAYFESVGEQVKMHLDIPDFYIDVTQNFVRLYARVNYIRNQLLIFKEREYVRIERSERGY